MAFVSVGPAAVDVTGTTRKTNALSVPIPITFVPRRLTLIAQECEVFIRRPAGPSFVPIHGRIENSKAAHPQPFNALRLVLIELRGAAITLRADFLIDLRIMSCISQTRSSEIKLVDVAL